jgi:hypothetical protein
MKVFQDKQKLKQYMTTKPPLQKILQGIQHTEDESKQNHERPGSIKPLEKKRQNSIDLTACNHSLKQQKQLNGRKHQYLSMLN